MGTAWARLAKAFWTEVEEFSNEAHQLALGKHALHSRRSLGGSRIDYSRWSDPRTGRRGEMFSQRSHSVGFRPGVRLWRTQTTSSSVTWRPLGFRWESARRSLG